MKKFKRNWIFSFMIMGIILMLASSCKKEEDSTEVPTLTTSEVLKITDNSATSGGSVTSDGGGSLTARGVCWSTSASPVLTDHFTDNGGGSGTFVSEMTNLQSNTTYHVRAYASNSAGTSYGNEVTFTTPPTVTDIDGNTYHTVNIGGQVWMSENLRVTHYRNGDALPNVTDNTEWINLTSGAWCNYNNDPALGEMYGKMYNLYAILDARNISPSGWHVPTDAEWKILEGNVDSQYHLGDPQWDVTGERGYDVGGKLKSTSTVWNAPNTGATDETGFSALPGGARDPDDGTFASMNMGGFFASVSSLNQDGVNYWYRDLWYANSTSERLTITKTVGGSVRCIKD